DGPAHRRGGTRAARRSGAARRDDRGPARRAPAARARRGGGPGGRDRARDAAGPAGMKQYRRLLSYLRPYVWPRFALAVACMLAFSVVETSVPFVAKFGIDQVFKQQHPEALAIVVFLVLVTAFLRGGLDFVGGYLNDWVGQRVVTDLRNQLTAHMQRLDLAFFNRRRAGQIVSRVTSDVGIVRGLVTDAVTSIFEDLARLIGLMAMAVYFDWVLALVTVCLFPVAALPLRYFSSQLRQARRRMQEGIGRLNALLSENVQGNRAAKAFGPEPHEHRRLVR